MSVIGREFRCRHRRVKEKASPLSQGIVYSYFEREFFPEAYRVFNPRLVARAENLRKNFNEIVSAKRGEAEAALLTASIALEVEKR
jgi:hypothetical protein